MTSLFVQNIFLLFISEITNPIYWNTYNWDTPLWFIYISNIYIYIWHIYIYIYIWAENKRHFSTKKNVGERRDKKVLIYNSWPSKQLILESGAKVEINSSENSPQRSDWLFICPSKHGQSEHETRSVFGLTGR